MVKTKRKTDSTLQVFEDWYTFLNWLLDHTDKFPKRMRFTITSKLESLALSVLDQFITVRYETKAKKKVLLKKINLDIEKMRVFIRLSHDRKALNVKSYNYAVKELQSIGKQIGGWMKALL